MCPPFQPKIESPEKTGPGQWGCPCCLEEPEPPVGHGNRPLEVMGALDSRRAKRGNRKRKEGKRGEGSHKMAVAIPGILSLDIVVEAPLTPNDTMKVAVGVGDEEEIAVGVGEREDFVLLQTELWF
ncbi:hypothetical protein BY996DRAFT_6509574 [Phakopsora pachyrhizi]|nr:hypothetical protein BY996DRAFT_6509574 [Phakopsora pachyrhizi]